MSAKLNVQLAISIIMDSVKSVQLVVNIAPIQLLIALSLVMLIISI